MNAREPVPKLATNKLLFSEIWAFVVPAGNGALSVPVQPVV